MKIMNQPQTIISASSDCYQNNQIPNSPFKPWAFLIAIVMAFGSSFGYGLGQVLLVELGYIQPTEKQQTLTIAEYYRLTFGMTPTDVEAILGRGVEVEGSAAEITYIWKNPNGSQITVIFVDGKLSRRTQIGLE